MTDTTWPESAADVWKLFKESSDRMDKLNQEAQARMDKLNQETQAQFQETDAKFRDTDRKLNRLEGLFGVQWGKMIEAMVQPNALRLFQNRGIQVHYAYQRVKSQRNGKTMELDLLLENNQQIVIIEVKSTLKVSDVQDFLTDLEQFFEFFPRYKNYLVYAGVAGLDIVEEADRYAYRRGLFVLGIIGDGVVQIMNNPDFKPANFADTIK